MSRYLLLCRHASKNNNNHISVAGTKKIWYTFGAMLYRFRYYDIELEEGKEISDFFHGVEPRTNETMMIAATKMLAFEATLHEEPITQLGDDKWAAELKKNGLLDNLKKEKTLFKATRVTMGADFEKECQKCADGVKEMFNKMTGKVGTGFFHSPTVEMAAYGIGWPEMPEDLQLNDLDGILFKEESGNISVLGVMVANQLSPMEIVG